MDIEKSLGYFGRGMAVLIAASPAVVAGVITHQSGSLDFILNNCDRKANTIVERIGPAQRNKLKANDPAQVYVLTEDLGLSDSPETRISQIECLKASVEKKTGGKLQFTGIIPDYDGEEAAGFNYSERKS